MTAYAKGPQQMACPPEMRPDFLKARYCLLEANAMLGDAVAEMDKAADASNVADLSTSFTCAKNHAVESALKIRGLIRMLEKRIGET